MQLDINELLNEYEFALVKLNGSACSQILDSSIRFWEYKLGLTGDKALTSEKRHAEINKSIDRYNHLIDHFLRCFDEESKSFDSEVSQPGISFAWEDSEVSESILERASSLMSKTQCLIVIGYSFPGYNYASDRRLFEAAMPFLDEIVVQTNSYEASQSIIQKIKELDVGIDAEEIRAISDASEFYFPHKRMR